MLCFSSILTSDSQFSVICYSIFLYNSLYWYCTAILKFLISQFSILNSQLLATAVLCISISQLVILNSQLYWYCTAILKFLNSQFSILNSQFSIVGYSSVLFLNIPNSNSQFSIIKLFYSIFSFNSRYWYYATFLKYPRYHSIFLI